jgi:DNA repair protein RadC
MAEWIHPGGKLRELGADQLTDEELLAILIGTGINGSATARKIYRNQGSS